MSREIIRRALQEALTAPEPVRVSLRLASGLESHTEALMDVPGIRYQTVSLETQQIDAHVEQKAVEAAKDAVSPAAPKPTVPAVFVTSTGGIAAGRAEDQSVLREAVKAKLDSGSDVAIALLPVKADEDDAEAEPMHADLIEAAKQFVADVDIPVLESIEAVHDWLGKLKVVANT